MKRSIAVVVAGALVFAAAVVLAQPAGGRPVLAVLEPGSAERPAPPLPWFWKGMNDLGWRPGQNLTVEIRYADWNVERFGALLTELAHRRPDVLYTHSMAAASRPSRRSGASWS
jgi:hypothetical protein